MNHSSSRWAVRPARYVFAASLLLGLLGTAGSPPVARAANDVTITVNLPADAAPNPSDCLPQSRNPCTLRSALALAQNPEPSGTNVTIDFAFGSATIGLSQSLGALQVIPPSGVNLAIVAPTASAPTISGQGNTRVFDVSGPGSATFSGVTISGGGNVPQGAGLFVEDGATLILSNVTVSDNQSAGTSGQVAQGGGIYVKSGASVTLSNVTVSGNRSTGFTGNDAQGGGIYVASGGSLTVEGSTMTGNTASGGDGNPLGGSADGGGIDDAGALTMTTTTLSDNTATGGNGVDQGAPAENGGAASGGGLAVEVSAAPPVLTALTSSGNIATGGVGASSPGIPGNGGAATGGGIDLASAFATLTNLTLSGNQAVGGNGGAGTNPRGSNGNGGDATGGNLATNETAMLVNLTIANGAATGGTGGTGGGEPGANGVPHGGGIGVIGGTTQVENSLLANQSISNSVTNNNCAVVAGTLTDGGYNLATDTSCGWTQPTSRTVGIAGLMLGPLQNNGGPTQTVSLIWMAPSPNPAIDTGGSAANGCPATDQRGVFRPQGTACDIGAYEYVYQPTLTSLSPSQGPLAGGTQVTLTGANFVPGATVTFGGQPASNVVVANATTITAQVPAGTSAGAVDVVVSDPSGFGDSSGVPGTLPAGFTYLAPTPTPTSTPTPTATPRSDRLYLPLVRNGAPAGGG